LAFGPLDAPFNARESGDKVAHSFLHDSQGDEATNFLASASSSEQPSGKSVFTLNRFNGPASSGQLRRK